MARPRQFYTPSPLLRQLLGPFAWRPRLTSGVVAGLLAFIGLAVFVKDFQWSSDAVLAWNLTCVWFIALALLDWRRWNGSDIKARVAAQDEGNGLILVVVLVAAVASLGA